MSNNLDINNLLTAINNGDLTQSISRLQKALSSTGTKNEEQSENSSQAQFIIPENYVKHLDRRINFIMALLPLLSAEKQEKAEELLKPLNLAFFLNRYINIVNNSGI
ncbi:MAG: hypothetical protein GX922_04010 [Firmicutes bacterium]|nr:hypothetical protein [Bacillota bacterium]